MYEAVVPNILAMALGRNFVRIKIQVLNSLKFGDGPHDSFLCTIGSGPLCTLSQNQSHVYSPHYQTARMYQPIIFTGG